MFLPETLQLNFCVRKKDTSSMQLSNCPWYSWKNFRKIICSEMISRSFLDFVPYGIACCYNWFYQRYTEPIILILKITFEIIYSVTAHFLFPKQIHQIGFYFYFFHFCKVSTFFDLILVFAECSSLEHLALQMIKDEIQVNLFTSKQKDMQPAMQSWCTG